MAEAIIKLLAGIGAFMIGFKILSENMETLANSGLKKMFNKKVANRFVGVGVGAAATALVQSSAATTVLVVGLVNSGIIDLFLATTVIMGANIGTTITAQIAALSSFNISTYMILLTVIGVFINMIAKKDKTKTLGFAIAGMGLLFLGLGYMKDSMVGFADNEIITNTLASWTNPLLLLLIGMVATAVVQSSAAITTIIISMVGAGIMIGGSGNGVFYVVLGTNIGTCLTALISSVGANANAKRASLIHLMFNVFGSVLFMIILLAWPGFKASTFDKWFPELPETQIAMFHTMFNVLCTAIFLPFPQIFVKLSKLLIKDKKVETKKLVYMDERMLEYPTIALSVLTKEISHMSYIAINALNLSVDSFLSKDADAKSKVDAMNVELEETNRAIIEYMVKISGLKISFKDEKLISAFHRNLNDIMRLGELADNITKYTNTVVKDNLEFSSLVSVEIGNMKTLINDMYRLVDEEFISRKKELVDQINAIEETIDNMRSKLINEHLDRLKVGKCQPQSSGVFINLVNNLERAADHLTYIAESI